MEGRGGACRLAGMGQGLGVVVGGCLVVMGMREEIVTVGVWCLSFHTSR